MRESDERWSGRAASLAPFPHFGWVSVWISGLVPDGMDQHSLSRGIVRSYTWGATQLLLFLLVHYILLLWWRPAIGKKGVAFPSFHEVWNLFFIYSFELFVFIVQLQDAKSSMHLNAHVMKLGADLLLSEWCFKGRTGIQWASLYLWKTRSLPCVALSMAEIMTRRHCRGCADISICFISISDKAFHLPFRNENVLF